MFKKFALIFALVLIFVFNLSSQEKSNCCSDERSKKTNSSEAMRHSDHQEHSHDLSMESSFTDTTKKSGTKYKHDSHKKMDKVKKTQKQKSEKVEKADPESWVRKGVIDLKSIDKNGDGKVYQDQMCWNVISDVPGNCPLCEMKLKEVSLEKAKENLLKHNFKVK